MKHNSIRHNRVSNNYVNLTLIITTVVLASTALSGCSTLKGWMTMRDNGSLEYQDSKLLAPIQIPADKQTQSFTPLYPTIDLGNNSIKMTHAFGKQYQLPAPQKTVR